MQEGVWRRRGLLDGVPKEGDEGGSEGAEVPERWEGHPKKKVDHLEETLVKEP